MSLHNKQSLGFLLGLSILVSSCATTNIPETWRYLGETNWGDIQHYINIQTINRHGKIVIVESKNVLKIPESISYLEGKKYFYDINHWEFDCQVGKVKLLSVEYFNKANQSIFSFSFNNPKKNNIPKGSILDELYHFACKK